MRPPDENQHGSTRPDLLAGGRRHVAGDDNILERLERDSARQASGNRSRAAWYAASAASMLLLVVILAWTAYDNANSVHVVAMTRVPADGLPGTAVKTAESDNQPLQDPAPVQAPPSLREPLPVTRSDNIAGAPPPLVLLPAHEARSKTLDAPAKPPGPAPASVAAPVKPVVRASPPLPQTVPVARLAPHPAVPARPRKAGSAALSTEALVDTDVALLSAIIIHDSAHAEEKAQLEAAATCARTGTKKCTGRNVAGPGSAN